MEMKVKHHNTKLDEDVKEMKVEVKGVLDNNYDASRNSLIMCLGQLVIDTHAYTMVF